MKKIDIHIHAKEDDPYMDRYVEIMDKYNVVAALVHGVKIPGLSSNENVLKVVKRHPKKLYGSVYVDFRMPIKKCIDLIKKYSDFGFKSIKLFPNYGYDPNDDKFEPIWKEVEKRKLLCLSHCGWLILNEHTKDSSALTASPFHFEVPAKRHPNINFIFAHFGGAATYLETIVLTSRLKNAFADTCPGWGKWVFENELPGLKSLHIDQIMYGTDNAGENYGKDEIWWTKKLKKLGYSEEDIYKYFYLNAAKLLGIEK
jgi:predicted TIM-barrel fold metal-dependent hydrolase